MQALVPRLREQLIAPELRVTALRLFEGVCAMPPARAAEIEAGVWELEHNAARAYVAHANGSRTTCAPNPSLVGQPGLPRATDEEMARGTLAERVQIEEDARIRALENLLERAESMNAADGEGLLRCRKCGHGDISWQQKQTRGADVRAPRVLLFFMF